MYKVLGIIVLFVVIAVILSAVFGSVPANAAETTAGVVQAQETGENAGVGMIIFIIFGVFVYAKLKG